MVHAKNPRLRFGRFKTLATGVALIALTGCSQISRPEQAQAGEQVAVDAFLHQHLQNQSFVTVGEAYRAMIMLAEGDDTLTSFAAREEYLLQRHAIKPEWKLCRENAIDRGTVAYMMLTILKIRGGVNLNTFGKLGVGDRRYALRELVYHQIMTDLPPYRLMGGPELVDVLGNADAYLAKNGGYSEPETPVAEAVTSQPAGR